MGVASAEEGCLAGVFGRLTDSSQPVLLFRAFLGRATEGDGGLSSSLALLARCTGLRRRPLAERGSPSTSSAPCAAAQLAV